MLFGEITRIIETIIIFVINVISVYITYVLDQIVKVKNHHKNTIVH